MATKTKRYDINPFVGEIDLTVGTKSVKISTIGKDENILVNQATGEVQGTHVVAYKKVDKEKFVKAFANYMAFTFELSKAGNKALRVVMWAMQVTAINRDLIVLDKYTLEDFLKDERHENLQLSYPTFMRGLGELCGAQILAKAQRSGMYFINPSVMFNGDRIAFTTVIERASDDFEKNSDIDDQLELPDLEK